MRVLAAARASAASERAVSITVAMARSVSSTPPPVTADSRIGLALAARFSFYAFFLSSSAGTSSLFDRATISALPANPSS